MFSGSFIGVIVVLSASIQFCRSSAAVPSFCNGCHIVESQTLESPHPYEFPALQNGSNGDSGQFPMPKCHGFQLEEATIDQLQRALSKNELSSVQIVTCYWQRMLQVDEYIRSVMSFAPRRLRV